MKAKNYEGLLVDRNIEIFELEETIKVRNKEINELKKYQGMYFKKLRELDKIKKLLLNFYENSNDHIRYEIDNILDEIYGIKRR